MQTRFTAMLVGTACLLTQAAPVEAGMITFSTSQSQFDSGVDNQGWWSASNNFDSNANYFTTGTSYRSFFTFDLSSLTDPAVSATLRLTRFGSHRFNETSETLGFFGVSTDAATLNDNSEPNAAIFNDIGSGTSFGLFSVSGSGASSDILEFTLNSAAVRDINAAGGYFSIGGSLVSNDGNDGLFVGSSDFGTQELVVETASVSAVPEPSSLVLLWTGAAGLLGLGRRRRRRTERT